jgi:hypothetical protein
MLETVGRLSTIAQMLCMMIAPNSLFRLIHGGDDLRVSGNCSLLSNSWEGCRRWLRRDKLEAEFGGFTM